MVEEGVQFPRQADPGEASCGRQGMASHKRGCSFHGLDPQGQSLGMPAVEYWGTV